MRSSKRGGRVISSGVYVTKDESKKQKTPSPPHPPGSSPALPLPDPLAQPPTPFKSPASAYEKLTNLGSLGLPSGPMPFFANRPSVYILRASSKLTRRFFMIFCISRLLLSSRPALLSPLATLPDRSKAEEDRPDSMSPAKVEGRRE